jgi:hypothetical protein
LNGRVARRAPGATIAAAEATSNMT